MGVIKKIKKNKDEISFCHELNLIVAEIISFKSGSTNNGTTAEKASFKAKNRSLSRLCSYYDKPKQGYLIFQQDILMDI